MSSYLPSTFLGASAIEIALLFFVGGTLILLKSLHTQDRQNKEQKLLITELAEQLKNCIDHQVAAQEQVAGLHEQCVSLNARQQLVEKHGSDVQRIDLAMRMLKRGAGSAETLHDLGLSSSEIKLLLTLHSKPASDSSGSSSTPEKVLRPVEPVAVKSASTQKTAAVESVNTVQAGVSESKTHPASPSVSRQESKQGMELAKLFKARAVS